MFLAALHRRRRNVLVPQAAAALMLLGFATGVSAQTLVDQQAAQGQTGTGAQPVTQAAKPYRGLFGGGSAPAPGRQQFDLTTNVYEEYGTNGESAVAGTTTSNTPGWFVAAQGRLAFQSTGQHSSFALRLDGNVRYYRDTRTTTTPGARAEIAWNTRVGYHGTSSVAFTASAEYQPYYVLPVFEGAVAPAADAAILPTNRDDLLYRRTGYIYGETFGYQHPISQRTYFALTEDARVTRTQSADLDVDSIRGGAVFGVRLSQYAALVTGYAYQFGQSGPQRSVKTTGQDVILSVDYRRPLPRARRTTFGFSSGSSRVTSATTAQWFILGTVNLRHEFDAGWFIQADFGRRMQMVEGFSSPFFVNTVTGSLGGFLGRRVEVLTSGGYSRGDVGFGTDAYRSTQGSARMRLALAKYVAVDVEGLLNQYAFDQQVVMPGLLPANLNRWAVRCNVALWLPMAR